MNHQILVGDAIEQLHALPNGSVNCVVTSPPYWGLRDYGVSGQIGLEATPEEYVAKLVAVFRQVRRVLAKDGTLWLNIGDTYATGGGKVGVHPGGGVRGARWSGDPGQPGFTPRDDHNGRGTPTSTAVSDAPRVNFGPRQQPNRLPIPGLKAKDLVGAPWRIAFALQADGWTLRSEIIWHKPAPMPESVLDRPSRSHEQIFLFAKRRRYYYDAEAVQEAQSVSERTRRLRESKNGHRADYTIRRDEDPGQRKAGQSSCTRSAAARHRLAEKGTRNRRTVWTVSSTRFKGAHFATFPPKLVEPCILAGTKRGGVVLDPFAGAGTVALVCEQLGRDSISIELNPEYAEMIRARVVFA